MNWLIHLGCVIFRKGNLTLVPLRAAGIRSPFVASCWRLLCIIWHHDIMTEAIEAQVRQEDHPKQLQLRALDVFHVDVRDVLFSFFFPSSSGLG